MIGKTIEGWRIVTELGSGPTGDVWFAERAEGEGRAAVKIVREELCSSSELLDAVIAEIRAVSDLQRPDIVSVEEVGRLDGALFIVEELIEGETLEERMEREERVSAREAARIGAAIADAVQAAHEGGTHVHRGIKPQNVFLVGDTIKVTDFGVDALLTDSDPAADALRYAAPEVCRGDTAVDHRADIYSLGALLYHLCTSRPPFEEEEADGLVVAHTTRAPRAAREVWPGLPPWLDELLTRALAKDPDERVESMAVFAEALRDGVRRMPAPPPPPSGSSTPKPPPPSSTPADAKADGSRSGPDSDGPELTMESLPPELMESLPPDQDEEVPSAPPPIPPAPRLPSEDADSPEERQTRTEEPAEKVEAGEPVEQPDEEPAADEPVVDVEQPDEKAEADEPAAEEGSGEEAAAGEAEGPPAADAGTETEDAEQQTSPSDNRIRIFNSEPPPLEERQRRVVERLSRGVVQRVLSGSLELPGTPEGVTAFTRLVTQTSSDIDAAEVLESDEELEALLESRWASALFVARLAKELAFAAGDDVDPQLAYLAPLVLEAGRPLVERALPAVEGKLKEPDAKYVDDQVREEVVELCHREVAVSLAYAWGLPPTIPQALPNAGTLTEDEPRSLQNVLTLAQALAAEAGKFPARASTQDLVSHLERGRRLLGLDEAACADLVERAGEG